MMNAIGTTQKMAARRLTSRWNACATRDLNGSRVKKETSGKLLLDERHGVAHGIHGIRVFVLDLDVELVLEIQDDVH